MRKHSSLEWRSQRRLRDAWMWSDADIEAEIRSGVIGKVVGVNSGGVAVSVDQGVVKMAGVVAERREAVRLVRLAGKVPGVSRVESSVTWEADTPYPGRRPRFA
ncbi:MAG: BON domain-containing protein, partial [Acidimicrobiia bacterium]|nr:BON domain-containing protein [Acidimicrobiia bacterium]